MSNIRGHDTHKDCVTNKRTVVGGQVKLTSKLLVFLIK